MRNFRKIRTWELADDVAVTVYKATADFPKEEVYGLTSQLRRAASSVPANIAEGASRAHKKEYLQFLYVARGSLAETDYFLHLARRLGYLNDVQHDALADQVAAVGGSLHNLLQAVQKECG